MTEVPPFEAPPITDEDIHRVCELLGLPEIAFCGQNGCDPRAPVLKCMQPIDVAACPGSGKTTLLVAKLAILAEEWPYRTRGICVLSHTNAARREIESRLGNTTGGRRLLSYPHYVGTIHGFVDGYLAVPWLRSCGYPIKMINTEICQEWRWWQLRRNFRYALQRRRQDRSALAIKSTDFDVELKGIGPDTPTCRECKDACRRSAEEGYFCYDEMFIWAQDLLERFPGVVAAMRSRFPVLFIDEAQDNSEEQSSILYRIFMDGEGTPVRQRLGDLNQGVFDSPEASEASTDRFPDEAIKQDLPNSHRFGQTIAKLADPLGLVPYGLIGEGPRQPLESGPSEGQHTIFLFAEGDACKVLPAYGHLLIATFSERELREGVFTAVGQVHRPPEKEDRRKYPHHVGHYWPDYDPQLTAVEPKPRTFVQYIFAGMGRAQATGEASHCVEKIAEGILRLAGMVEAAGVVPRRTHRHRYLRRLLEGSPTAMGRYEELLAAFAVERNGPTEQTWADHWCPSICEIVEAIAGGAPSGKEAEGFLSWADVAAAPGSLTPASQHRDNVYRHSRDGKGVAIRVGSIHSAKGETHTATLVLETFYHGHNLKLLKPWLVGERSGAESKPRQDYRLKLHYVAMTRPTHLLCLAMRRAAFEDDLDEATKALGERGWQVKCL